jgi:diacylglycerol kinase (ATP)
MAHELGLPLDPVRALQVALKRTTRWVDLGELRGGMERRFLFVAGIGYDAYVVSRVRPELKKKLGKAAFFLEAIRGLRDYAFPEFQVVVGDRTFNATSCLACNARSYGGGLLFCPGADMRDGLLDILIIQGRRRIELVRFLFLAWCGKAAARDWIHRLQTKTLRAEGPAEIMIQADGELVGHLPIDISLADLAFQLAIP